MSTALTSAEHGQAKRRSGIGGIAVVSVSGPVSSGNIALTVTQRPGICWRAKSASAADNCPLATFSDTTLLWAANSISACVGCLAQPAMDTATNPAINILIIAPAIVIAARLLALITDDH